MYKKKSMQYSNFLNTEINNISTGNNYHDIIIVVSLLKIDASNIY